MQTEQALYEKKFIETCSLLKGLIVPHKTNLSKVRLVDEVMGVMLYVN